MASRSTASSSLLYNMSSYRRLNRPLAPPAQRAGRHGQDHSDTQRSLQEASDALETAFDHIRQVRRNLLRLSETFPERSRSPAINSNSTQNPVNPGHEALVLSGDTTEVQREPSLSSISYDLGSGGGNQEIGRVPNISIAPMQALPPRPPSPHWSGSMNLPPFLQPPEPRVVPPRFSRQNPYGFPILNADSAVTTHGLRVAAREANPNAHQRRESTRELSSLTEDYERFIAHHRVALGLDMFPAMGTSRGDAPSSVPVITASPPMFPAPNGNVPYVYTVDVRQPTTTADHSNRQNYLPPSSQPPTFGRSSGGGWLTTSAFSPRPRPTTPLDYMPPGTVGTMGENFEFTDDQFVSWLLPAGQDYGASLVPRRDPHNPDTIRITRANDPLITTSDRQPRRRGWARLDADGNEIPWDEEEELERSRTEYRLRVSHRTNEDSNAADTLRRDGQTLHGSVLDSMLSVPSGPPRRQQWRPPTTDHHRPFHVDPLPMPLASMMTEETKEETQDDYYPDVIVPKHACLAGR